MALPQPITISQQANFIQLALQNWAQPLGGTAKVVSNLKVAWAQAYQSSQKPILFICYQGDISRGPFEQQNAWVRVDRQWSVLFIRGRGFKANRGDTLYTTTNGVDALWDDLEAVRDVLRCLLGISEELPSIDFKSITPVSQQEDVIDSYELKFSTANDYPMILNANPQQPS